MKFLITKREERIKHLSLILLTLFKQFILKKPHDSETNS